MKPKFFHPKRGHFIIKMWTITTLGIGYLSCNDCTIGKGAHHTEERILDPFSEIETLDKIDLALLEIDSGSKNRLVLEAQANIIPLVLSEVQNGKLILSTVRCIDEKTHWRVTLYMHKPNEAKITGTQKGSNHTSEK